MSRHTLPIFLSIAFATAFAAACDAPPPAASEDAIELDPGEARAVGERVVERIALDTAALERTGAVGIEVGEHAVSLLFTAALEDETFGLGIVRVVAPDGRVLHESVFEDDSWDTVRFASDLVAEPVVGSGDIALFVPTPSGEALLPGTWRIELESDPADARFAHATGIVRTAGDIDAFDRESHAVDLHVHVVHHDARYRDDGFDTVLDTDWRVAADRVLAPHALRLGEITRTVSPPRETARLADLDDEREIAEACRVVRRAGASVDGARTTSGAPVLHVGFVATITSDGAADYTVDDRDIEEIADVGDEDGGDEGWGDDEGSGAPLTGLSPQPGLPFDGESPNACVFVAEAPWREDGLDGEPLDETIVVDLLVANLLHELGHFAGLAHPSEADGQTFDLLDDTPRCTAPDVESCGLAGGAGNLMFHSGDERTLPWTLTPDQARVLRVHPLFRSIAESAR